jgi:hypothetical protein
MPKTFLTIEDQKAARSLHNSKQYQRKKKEKEIRREEIAKGAADNETSPESTHHGVRRDPAAASVSLSSSLRSRKRKDPPASGKTMEERVENLENLLKTAVGCIHQLEKTVEDLKAGHASV